MATIIHHTDLARVTDEIVQSLANTKYFTTRMDDIAPADIEFEHYIIGQLGAYVYDQLCHSADVVFRETGCFRASTETMSGVSVAEIIETKYLKAVMQDVSKHLTWHAIGRAIAPLAPRPIIEVTGGSLFKGEGGVVHAIFEKIKKAMQRVAEMKPVKVEIEGDDF